MRIFTGASHAVLLEDNVRHAGDPAFHQLLARVARGASTAADVAVLNTRCLAPYAPEWAKFAGATVIVRANAVRHAINWSAFRDAVRAFLAHGSAANAVEPTVFRAELRRQSAGRGTVGSEFVARCPPPEARTVAAASDDQTEGLPLQLPLWIGAPVASTANVDVGAGLANGVPGVVAGWTPAEGTTYTRRTLLAEGTSGASLGGAKYAEADRPPVVVVVHLLDRSADAARRTPACHPATCRCTACPSRSP